ncbi:MAG TPA: hypothetical protein VEF89_34430 [Solirubrobacteraceae bacterium]|nr:hypothetical protein [Solirubrobacteraceae bacterium]
MTQASVVQHRSGLWVTEVQDWGYEIRTPPDAGVVEGQLVVAARRRAEFGLPEVEITIRELWLPGRDPDRLSPVLEGCYLHSHSWHAQFDPARGDVAAERLDLDRSKARSLWLHRHPLGQPNEVKDPVDNESLFDWLHRVERLLYEAWSAGDD